LLQAQGYCQTLFFFVFVSGPGSAEPTDFFLPVADGLCDNSANSQDAFYASVALKHVDFHGSQNLASFSVFGIYIAFFSDKLTLSSNAAEDCVME